MGDRDWRIFREDFDIRVKGGKAPTPLRFWEEANLPPSLMEAIRELGYEAPSPIQRQVICRTGLGLGLGLGLCAIDAEQSSLVRVRWRAHRTKSLRMVD